MQEDVEYDNTDLHSDHGTIVRDYIDIFTDCTYCLSLVIGSRLVLRRCR